MGGVGETLTAQARGVQGDTYAAFLAAKAQLGGDHGFAPLWLPDFLFDFQRYLVEWAVRRGRAAIFSDCGTGKTPMQLVWAENIVRQTNRPVLILTPLAVGAQTVREGAKFGIEVRPSPVLDRAGIYITNYERLHQYDPADCVGVVCDESSILKHFSGATQKAVTRFMSKLPYRLLCTATAAPNDYIELGTASEALGMLGYSDMLSRFFVQDDKSKHRMNAVKLARGANTGNHFAKLAYRVSQQIGAWRLKGHAQVPFWRWVSSWARACRLPADLGFPNDGFVLPPVTVNEHIVEPTTPPDGMLFTLPAFGLRQEREERRRTLQERCEMVAQLVAHDRPAIVWCHLNAEGDALARTIPGARQVRGADALDDRERVFEDFTTGALRVLILKPKLGAWGMNWQHCAHVVTFASHSYEQFYQSVRRCWRFGQKQPVTVDIIATTGEQHVLANMIRKQEAATVMFDSLVAHMRDGLHIDRAQYAHAASVEAPPWL